jgi:hypothetical protein
MAERFGTLDPLTLTTLAVPRCTKFQQRKMKFTLFEEL